MSGYFIHDGDAICQRTLLSAQAQVPKTGNTTCPVSEWLSVPQAWTKSLPVTACT